MLNRRHSAHSWLWAGLLGLLLAAMAFFFIPIAFVETAAAEESFWLTQLHTARQLLETDPNNLDHQFRLATAQAMLGRVEESMETFETLTSLGADDGYARVIVERYGGKPEYENDLLIQTFLAFAYYVDKDYPNSVKAFDRVIELDPLNPWPLNYQGFSLYQCGQLDVAVVRLQKSLRLQPNNQYTHLLLGLAYYEQGHYLKALAEFAKAPGAIKKIFR